MHTRWRNAAAFGTWLVVSLPQLAAIASGRTTGADALIWLAAFALFGLALLPVLGFGWRSAPRGVLLLLLVVQTAAGLTMTAMPRNGTGGATMVIVAAEAASLLPWRVTWIWIAAQSVLITWVWTRGEDVMTALAVGGAFAGFQAFAASTVALARRERAAREELSRVNAELLATRSELAEHSRASERLRIARDLHDALGHHLTALSIQLDVASRTPPAQSGAHVREAHAIAKLLLGDVRRVVSELREGGPINLAEALEALAANARSLRVALELPSPLDVDDPVQAQTLLRCVQEIVTNTVKHADAQNLWIRIRTTPAGIDLQARDDVRGTAAVVCGHGLTGMRERFEAYAGRVEFVSRAGAGFEVHAFMPAAGAAS